MSQTTLVYSLYQGRKRLVTEMVSGQVGPVLHHIKNAIQKNGGEIKLRVRAAKVNEAIIEGVQKLDNVTTMVMLATEHYTKQDVRLSENLHKVIANPKKLKKLVETLQKLKELKLPDIEKGDILLAGKWKNKKCVVKGFTKDENNQPVAKTNRGDAKIFKPRIAKLVPGYKEEKPKEKVKESTQDAIVGQQDATVGLQDTVVDTQKGVKQGTQAQVSQGTQEGLRQPTGKQY